jgi:hypothetical protein
MVENTEGEAAQLLRTLGVDLEKAQAVLRNPNRGDEIGE